MRYILPLGHAVPVEVGAIEGCIRLGRIGLGRIGLSQRQRGAKQRVETVLHASRLGVIPSGFNRQNTLDQNGERAHVTMALGEDLLHRNLRLSDERA